jgi:hypothetical protein
VAEFDTDLICEPEKELENPAAGAASASKKIDAFFIFLFGS